MMPKPYVIHIKTIKMQPTLYDNSYKNDKMLQNNLTIHIKIIEMMPKSNVIHIKIIKMQQTLLDNSYKNHKNAAKPFGKSYKKHKIVANPIR